MSDQKMPRSTYKTEEATHSYRVRFEQKMGGNRLHITTKLCDSREIAVALESCIRQHFAVNWVVTEVQTTEWQMD